MGDFGRGMIAGAFACLLGVAARELGVGWPGLTLLLLFGCLTTLALSPRPTE
jgi:hypothetical protein